MDKTYVSSILGIGAVSCYGDLADDLYKAVKIKASPSLIDRKLKYKGESLNTKVYSVPHFDLLFPLAPAMERRLGRLARLCFQAILRAMDEAKFEVTNPSRVGIVIGTAHGSSSLVEKYSRRITLDGIKSASPILFSNSVHNSISSFVALSLGINGPSTTIVSKELSTAAAIERANAWLNEGVVDHVLVAVGDEIYNKIHVLNSYIKNSLNADGYNPLVYGQPIIGEGALGLVLSKSSQNSTNLTIKAKTLARPTSNDIATTHIVDFKSGFKSYEKALELCQQTNVASYSKHYGSFTTGSSMDVAIAGLALRQGEVLASTSHHPEIKTLKQTLQAQQVQLTQVSDQGEIGKIRLEI